MNQFKKIFVYTPALTVFVIGIMFLCTDKVSAAITVSVTADSTTVPYGGKTYIRWSAPGATICTRSDTGASYSGSSGFFETNTLTSNTTFTIDCNDGLMYYQLSRCNDHLTSWETIAKPDGTLQVGNVILGATGLYYIVTGSTRNDTSRTNINYSLALGYPCN